MSEFPIDSWLSDMKSAVDRIAELGDAVLRTHRAASDEAAQNADRWKLSERLADEQQALFGLFESVRWIVESIQQCRSVLHTGAVTESDLNQALGLYKSSKENKLITGNWN